MKPSEIYARDVAEGIIVEDATQEQVLQAFDRLYLNLEPRFQTKFSFWKTLFKHPSPAFAKASARQVRLQGIYLWGSVGRGKTYLMDTFYSSLTVPKLRQHFYEFMAYVHAELKMHQGKAEPLKLVAQDIAKRARILCFDEFFVEDIADAMILGSLFHYLFAEKMIIVATSNFAPDDLYEDGLQRDRFVPAITMIKQNMQVLHLDHGQDYRLIKNLCDHRYHSPLNDAIAFLAAQFNFLNHGQALLPLSFELNQRRFACVKRSATLAWFEFKELCVEARSSLDYLELGKTYKIILVNNIPALTADLEDAARRFMTLVDTCYDQQVLLILAAAVPLMDLYQGTRLNFEFERVNSRIIEMQSWKM